MPNDTDFKRLIEANLLSFISGDLRNSALQLLNTLGYKSNKQIQLQSNTPESFRTFLRDNGVQLNNEEKAYLNEWEKVEFLFQLTDEEISRNKSLFNSNQIDITDTRIESYVFLAIELKKDFYRRSDLAEITREINRAFPMPVMILFQHGNTLTFSIIDRRVNKRDEIKDVLLKITLIKDIRLENPHRAHTEILADLSLDNLNVKSFVELHREWQRILDTKELNKKFFQELANWYFWAVESVYFPDDEEKNSEIRNATNVIRLITRLMFVWFLKEKDLVSDKLFDEKYLKTILHFEDDSTFYKAILQNLFFATLNSEMNTRKFIAESSGGRNSQHFVHNVFRYKKEFIKPEETIADFFEPIPFLNGGLFECLDKETEVDGTKCRVRVDGFSDSSKNVLSVPDELFFGKEDEIDLNEIYGTKNKRYKVRGLINILNSYKFTIAENTPIEEEVALDPELLGKVFENLLASYNPETKTTARKQTGSFYTPREIVNYMVDESLIAYLKAKLQTETEGFSGYVAFGENQSTMFGNEGRIQQKFEMSLSNNRWHGKNEDLETALRDLFSYNETTNKFNELETEILIKAIDNCKILDPACGSGAFPMGILQRLVFLLKKLDTNNEKWREWQRQKAVRETEVAYKIGDKQEREDKLLEINDIFENNASDYGRKLFLIENCIYGVDIQPIAIQIAKLRFFISLIVDEKTNLEKENLGIRPLPNLETKFVAANTLIGFEAQGGLKPTKVNDLEKDLKEVRAKHFSARTRKTKEKYREKDKEIRLEIAELLKQGGIKADIADQIAEWNPYDQNASAEWFDAEYMFGIEKGFDIVIGNPPYIGQKGNKELFQSIKDSSLGRKYHQRRMDLFYFFFHFGLEGLKKGGILSFITTNYYLTATYSDKLRKHFYDDASILNLTNFNELTVFESAQGQHNLITILSKGKQANSMAKTATTKRIGIADASIIESFLNRTDTYSNFYNQTQDAVFEKNTLYLRIEPSQQNGVSGTSANIFSILDKLKTEAQPLEKYCYIEQGIVSGADKVSESMINKYPNIYIQKGEGIYVLTDAEVKRLFPNKEDRFYIKPTYKNSDLQKWEIKPKSLLYVLYIKSNGKYFDVGKAVKSHLDRFKLILINRNVRSGSITEKDYEDFLNGKKEISYIMNASSMKNGNYYCLSYPRRGKHTFEVPKIVNSRRAKSNDFALENNGFYEQSDMVITTLKPEFETTLNLKFILGLLNSKLIYNWLYYKGKRKGELLELFQKPLTEIPIKLGSEDLQTEISKIVGEIIEAKKNNAKSNIKELERKIDCLVYQLYGLTDEEIRIVEGKESECN